MYRYLLTLLALLFAVPACHELSKAADVVPQVVQCPPPAEGEALADQLIERFAADPEAVRHELTERATKDAMGALAVTCELLAVQSRLLETGKRFTEVYDEVTAGLGALGIGS